MKRHYLLLLALLAGCEVNAAPQTPTIGDSIAKQDYRLIVQAGRGEVAPGVPAEQQKAAKARCGTRFLTGLGDVIKPGQQDAFSSLLAFATEYNKQMLTYCYQHDKAK